MKKILATGLAVFCSLLYAPTIYAQAKGKLDQLPPLAPTIQPIVTNVEGPTSMAFPEKNVIWLLLQKGPIRVIKNGKLIESPLLDLRGKMIKVNDGYEERGLLGIALHPKLKTNRKFYVFYSAPTTNGSNRKDVVAEYRLSPSGTVDPGSARIVLSQEKPDGNHDGGCLQFGPDGYLYITFGDGGGQGDKHGEFGNGQKMDTWLGKILRVDVNTKAGYLVPKDNPYVGKKGFSLYGGEKGVIEKINKSDDALSAYRQTGKVSYVPAASATDKNAPMFGDFPYYLDPKRGAIKEWPNQFAVMAWRGWLEFDAIQSAPMLTVPVQIIHSEAAALPEGAKIFYDQLKSPKNIIWMEKPTQFDFYDQEPHTSNAVTHVVKWFNRTFANKMKFAKVQSHENGR